MIYGTIFVLPSFINPLLPFVIILASIILNRKLCRSNEILVIKQYFSIENNLIVFLSTALLVFLLYSFNNEFFSVNTYSKYKIKELEIRNNLKLGYAENNEMHIDDLVSLFFQKKNKDTFHNIEAIIYEQNQFIKSNSAELEFSKSNFNVVFYNGERIMLNENEKSKTQFEKFVFSLEDKDLDKLTFDKEHFNTLSLLKSENKTYVSQGHNRIYQYFLLITVILISYKIIFFDSKNSLPIKVNIIFIILIVSQVINTYLIYVMNKNDGHYYELYYLINFILLISIYTFSNKLIKQ